MNQTLDLLAAEIHYHEEEARKGFGLALQHKVAIGKRLELAKKQIGHGAPGVRYGTFLGWARNEFGWTPQHVHRHLTLGRNAAKVLQMPPDTSLRMALASIKSEQPGAVEIITAKKIHITLEVLNGKVEDETLVAALQWVADQLEAKTAWTIR